MRFLQLPLLRTLSSTDVSTLEWEATHTLVSRLSDPEVRDSNLHVAQERRKAAVFDGPPIGASGSATRPITRKDPCASHSTQPNEDAFGCTWTWNALQFRRHLQSGMLTVLRAPSRSFLEAPYLTHPRRRIHPCLSKPSLSSAQFTFRRESSFPHRPKLKPRNSKDTHLCNLMKPCGSWVKRSLAVRWEVGLIVDGGFQPH